MGKKAGMRRLKNICKSKKMLRRIATALDTYIDQINKDKTDKKYIKHFSTFINNWEDYFDEDDVESEYGDILSSPLECEEIEWMK